jgi:hypothetical protein
VRVASLPLEGAVLPGKIIDLSLGGCCIETAQPLPPGAPAEIVIRVNNSSFRALGQIKAIRGRSAGMQFLRLTDAGKRVLRDVLAEVAKFHVPVSALRRARNRQNADLVLESADEEVQKRTGKAQSPILWGNSPAREETAALADHQESALVSPASKICVVSVDVFV